ncbi:MAG: YidC/Oxa1 family membrane protein insertase [bacterium]
MTTIAAGFMGIESFTPPWDVFFLPLFNLLIFLYGILFSDFALAIIVLTIVIRTVLAPLFLRQIRSSREMQRMQPLIREVQRKHKGNRQKITEETMALYREHGVNPAAGCLPVLLQLPILFALYQVLIRASGVIQGFNPSGEQLETFNSLKEKIDITALAGAGNYQAPVSGPCNLPEFAHLPQFLPLNCQLVDPVKLAGSGVDTTIGWLANLDLAQIDRVFSLALGGEAGFHLSALAVIAGLLQFVQVKMTTPPANPDDPASSATSTMVYLFPLLTVFWGGLFPSGLILYWAVYTAYLIVQQYLMMGWGNLFPIFGWRPRFAPATQPGIVSPARVASRPAEPGGKPNQPSTTRPETSAARANPGPTQRRSGRRRRGRRR